MHIQNIAHLFEQHFPADWQESFITEAIGQFDGQEDVPPFENYGPILFKEKFNKFLELYFEQLNLSIIAGEYISVPDFLSRIEYIKSYSEALREFDQEETFNISYNEFNEILLLEFKKDIKYSLDSLRLFYNSIERKNKKDDAILLIDGFKIDDSDKSEFILKKLKVLLNDFIKYNIGLAQIDHDLAVKPVILRELVFLRHQLKSKINESYIYDLLLDKCTILIKKLLYRFREDKKNYIYALDFEDKEILRENLDIKYYKKFSELAHIYDEVERTDSEIYKRSFNSAFENAYKKFKRDEKLLFEEYHCLVKYFKDENIHLESLLEIEANFTKQYAQLQEQQNTFDKRAFEISSNYIKNNIFSLQIKNSILSTKTLSEKLYDLNFYQTQTNVKNYFPYLRSSQFIIDDLRSELDKFSSSSDLNALNINHIIDFLDKTKKELYEKFEWCDNRNFQAYQLPFDECKEIISIPQNKAIIIFLSSSFILPINYQKIKEDIDDLSKSIDNQKRIFEFHKIISNEKFEIKKLKESFDKTEKRSIEILSIFSAIVLFASSNIQIFTKIDNLAQGLGFMLVFAYSLSIFILLIWIITRENGFNYTKLPDLHKALIAIVLVATIASYIIVFGFQNSVVKTEKKEQIKLDTVELNIINKINDIRKNK